MTPDKTPRVDPTHTPQQLLPPLNASDTFGWQPLDSTLEDRVEIKGKAGEEKPLQLDVFHALWDLYNPDTSPRPTDTSRQGNSLSREDALRLFPTGTTVKKSWKDKKGKDKWYIGSGK
ncbi:unnamed protein product [Choristocarpus tenellus]